MAVTNIECDIECESPSKLVPPLPKHFLSALYQADTSDKSRGLGNLLWHVTLTADWTKGNENACSIERLPGDFRKDLGGLFWKLLRHLIREFSLSLCVCVCVHLCGGGNHFLALDSLHTWYFSALWFGTPESISVQLLDSEVCKTHAKVAWEAGKHQAEVWLYLEVVVFFVSSSRLWMSNSTPLPHTLFFLLVLFN